jgi:hypothetical protein
MKLCESHEYSMIGFSSTRGLIAGYTTFILSRAERLRFAQRRYLATATAQSTRSLTALFLPVRLHFALVLFLVRTQKRLLP